MLVKTYQLPSNSLCLEKCKEDNTCNWYSYAEELKSCILLEDCKKFDEKEPKFESGQKECPLSFSVGKHFKKFFN